MNRIYQYSKNEFSKRSKYQYSKNEPSKRSKYQYSKENEFSKR